MQATGVMRAPRGSKGLAAVAAAMVTSALLGGAGGYLAKAASGESAPASGLGEAGRSEASSWSQDHYSAQRGGLQTGAAPVAPSQPVVIREPMRGGGARI